MAQDNPLAKMITDFRTATGASYAEIARRGSMSRSVVHALATLPITQPPRRATLQALARGLGVTEEVVTRAATAAAGYHVYEEATPDSQTQILIGNYEKLSPSERAQVAALAEKLLREHDTH